MKKSVLRVGITVFAVAVAFLLAGCEDAASPNNGGLVDGFLVRVNEKPGSSGGGSGATIRTVVVSSEASDATGSGSYVVGQTVFINAGTRPIPYRFVKWTANKSVKFADESKAVTSFIMPANDVTVTAVFWDYGTFTDARDSKKYKTTTIGGKTWMAEDMNYKTSSGSWCYNNDESNCNAFGRLYDWNTAMTVCPTGWHLPDRQEWSSLETTAGGSAELMSASGWCGDYGNGTDEYGFSALPGGYRYSKGTFYEACAGYWWTATEDGSGNAYGRLMGSSNGTYGYAYNSYYDVGNGFSVRCVKD